MKRSALLLVLFALLVPVCLAGATEATLIVPQASPVATSTTEYLIGLPPPQELPDTDGHWRDVPPGQLLQMAAEQQAGPILTELRQLQARGEILGFALDPEQFAVRVWAAGPLPILNVDAVVATAGEGLPSCAEGLPEAVVDMARTSSMVKELAGGASRVPSDKPTINVYIRPPYAENESHVFGFAEPDSSITMWIYRDGSPVQEWHYRTNAGGFYTMYPDWERCPRSGYAWHIQPGDVIEIEDGVGISRMTVVPIFATLDPVAKIAEGQTVPNRKVFYDLHYPLFNSEWIDWEYGWGEIQSDKDGLFEADLDDVLPYRHRSAYAYFYVEDENGNTTYSLGEAHNVQIEQGDNAVWGTVNRDASGTVELNRGGRRIARAAFVAEPTGSFRVSLYNETILPGDVITVQDGKQTNSITVSSAEFWLDVAAGSLRGTNAQEGYKMAYTIHWRGPYDLAAPNPCRLVAFTGYFTFGSDGLIDTEFYAGLRPGDYGYVTLYDREENMQFRPPLLTPTIVTGLGLNSISGYWHRPYTDLDVRLYDSGDNLRAEEAAFAGYHGRFDVRPGVAATIGDRVEVSDGVETRSMTVLAVGGRLNSWDNEFVVTGPDRPFLVAITNYDGYMEDGSHCYEYTLSGGQITVDPWGRVSPGDSAHVFMMDAGENYTRLDLSAYKVYLIQDATSATVLTETPDAQIRLLHRRAGQTVYDETLTAEPPGSVSFTSDETFLAGDTVRISEVTAGERVIMEETLTPLSMATEPDPGRVFGQVPPEHDGKVRLVRFGASGWAASRNIEFVSDESGNYEVWLDPGEYWGGDWRRPCWAVGLGDRCAKPGIEYLTSSHHTIELPISAPPPAAADAFESDNTAATARAYQGGTQTRTFHTSDDVDWIKVDVPAWAVGFPVHFVAHNMGWDVAVDLALYRSDGTTAVNDAVLTDTGDEILLTWEPDEAGTYLLRVAPLDEAAGGHCDSFYDLRIDFAVELLHLPAILG